MSFTSDLAERIVATRLAQVNPAAIAVAVDIFTDTVGCMLAGFNEEGARVARRFALGQGTGEATIIGASEGASPYMAAVANGTAAAILDYDDGSWRVIGHPSGCVLPAIFALGEARHISGAQALEAYIIGYETIINLAKGTAEALYMTGRHNTGTLGVFGAAAACARLLELTVPQTRMALGIAASCSAALRAGHGTMTKGLHSGNAAAQGMMSALLARDGMTAQPDIFEHRYGFFQAFVNTGECRPVDVTTAWGNPWGFLEPDVGPGLKLIPSGTVCFCSAECALEIVAAHRPEPTAVRRIVWRTTPAAMDVAQYRVPADRNQAFYCIPWGIAAGLVRGRVGLAEFDDAAIADPLIRAVCARVEMEVHPDLADVGTADFSAGELQVHMADGQVHRHMRRRPRAYPGGEPWTAQQLAGKFLENARRGLPSANPRDLLDALLGIAEVRDLAELLARFRPNRPR